MAFGTDEQTPLSKAVAAYLAEAGHTVECLADPAPWPEVGRVVGEAVADGRAERGVVCCWTGTGVSIAANKVDGVRAALCLDAGTTPTPSPSASALPASRSRLRYSTPS